MVGAGLDSIGDKIRELKAEKPLVFGLTIGLCALVFVALIIAMIQTAPQKKPKAPPVDDVTLDAPLFIPDAPNLAQDYYPSRTTGTVWTSEELETWFTALDEESLGALEDANDRLVSDITGAAP